MREIRAASLPSWADLQRHVRRLLTSGVTNLPAKSLAGRTRAEPATVPEVRRLVRRPPSTSVPSGHAASATAFATAVSLERPELRVPIGSLAGAVAISRVYTGVHYPGDVLVGSAIGFAVARRTVGWWPLAERTPAIGGDLDGGPADSRRYVDPDGTRLIVVADAGAGNTLADAPERELRRGLSGARVVEAEPGEDLPRTLRRAAVSARVLADRCLDVRLIDAEGPWSRARVPGAVLTGRLRHRSARHRWTAHRLTVSSTRGSPRLAADGETWSGPDTVTFRIRAGALLVLQPPGASVPR